MIPFTVVNRKWQSIDHARFGRYGKYSNLINVVFVVVFFFLLTVVWSIKAPFRDLFVLMELIWLQSDGKK